MATSCTEVKNITLLVWENSGRVELSDTRVPKGFSNATRASMARFQYNIINEAYPSYLWMRIMCVCVVTQ